MYLRNPWLTYGLVLHRYREHGFRVPVLDAIDERALTVYEIRDLCLFLFGDLVSLPDPGSDWNNFLTTLGAGMARERPHWNSVTKTVLPWINLSHLHAVYGRSSVPVYYSSHVRVPASFSQPSFQQQFMPSQQQQQHSFRQAQAHQQSVLDPLQTTVGPHKTPASGNNDLLVAVNQTWAKQPPTYVAPKPIDELLGAVGVTFALVPAHSYFATKYHPFAPEALRSGGYDVVKRAVRKMRLFLHPDRLPKDLNEQQSLLCRTLWDNISEAWELYDTNRNSTKQ